MDKPLYKRWWFWLVALIVVYGVFQKAGESPTKTDNVTTWAETRSEYEAKVKRPPNIVATYKLMDEIKVSGRTITVFDAERFKGNDVDKPKEGYEFIVVSFMIENVGNNYILYNATDFRMANSKGEIINNIISPINSDTELLYAEIEPDRSNAGTIVFEQPEGENNLTLYYLPEPTSNDAIAIALHK